MPSDGAEVRAKVPVALPTGTVTFLFSDVEGSTQRWERHREAMKAAVARHEQLMRVAIEQHGGYIFKSMGDAFCVAFPTPPQALRAAVDAQRAVAGEDFSSVDGLRVRMGLHTGYAEERNADYFGPAVNRAARLMSIGHGGQVLLSSGTRELAHSELPSGVSLVDLGSHRLKDLTEAEQVWQLTIEGLPASFAPLKSLDTIPNNLPIQPTSFRGREHDLEKVKDLLSQHKLLTLFGSGGVGKTRLALQVGAEVLDQYPDGVWLADFAPITDPELVSSIIAKELGMTQVEGRRVDESIIQWLKRKKLLLILDNCEHVLETVAAIANSILRACPDVRMLATSRQALGVSGEQVLRLPSLDVPHKIVDLTPEAVIEFGAVALFVDRARSVDASFALTSDSAPIVADICRRLDGIPLAIELAAARVKVLSIPNLAQRLNERFKILTSGSRSALPRQKTLSALIDWSYDLLNPPEQMLFTRAAIFAGGFSLDAATAVCGGEGFDEIEVLDVLSSLTDKSLVVADTSGEQERYHLLESTRAYALDKLIAAGERDRLARAHAEYFRHQAEEADERLGVGSTAAWFADVQLELDNYRAALEWALSQGNDAVVGAAIAGALQYLWRRGGLSVEGRYWIEPALERLDAAENPQVVARLWLALSGLHSARRACEAAEQAVRLYESVGDGHRAARALSSLAYGLSQTGRIDESDENSKRALAALREYGDKPGVAGCLRQQASNAASRGTIAAGRDLYAQALALYKAVGNEAGAAVVLSNLAELEFADGHPDAALRSVSESLATDPRRGADVQNMAMYRSNSAAYRIALGDLDGALALAREGLTLARRVQSPFLIAYVLQHLALIMALRDQTQSAAKLLGHVDAQLKELGWEREPTEQWGYEKLMAALREHLSSTEIEKLAAEGATWPEDKAAEETLRL
ncbi:MAG TPA: adenylate/guanylate cyclase domain-containing protein [Candidatus Eremiobacteraceae bacterium]|nr:adenylate/guanylate cyclase domain-containing protein [Candidatus Eremiobacteraceae bacterium]